MSTTTATRSKDATPDTRVGKVAMKLEVITIPVSDIDRATKFYGRLGWRQDVTPPGSGVVQFTPPGSACSVHFGTNRTSAAPGSAQNQFLIVSDIQAARDELAGRGVEVSEIFHFGPSGQVSGPAPDHATYASFATFSDPDGNSWLLQEITTRLPGRVDADRDGVRFGGRSGERVPACGGRPRRAREAHRTARRELARVVRRLHGGGAGRHRAALVTECLQVDVHGSAYALRPHTDETLDAARRETSRARGTAHGPTGLTGGVGRGVHALRRGGRRGPRHRCGAVVARGAARAEGRASARGGDDGPVPRATAAACHPARPPAPRRPGDHAQRQAGQARRRPVHGGSGARTAPPRRDVDHGP